MPYELPILANEILIYYFAKTKRSSKNFRFLYAFLNYDHPNSSVFQYIQEQQIREFIIILTAVKMNFQYQISNRMPSSKLLSPLQHQKPSADKLYQNQPDQRGTQIRSQMDSACVEYSQTNYPLCTNASFKSPLTGSSFKIFKRPKQLNSPDSYPEQLTFPTNKQCEQTIASRHEITESYEKYSQISKREVFLAGERSSQLGSKGDNNSKNNYSNDRQGFIVSSFKENTEDMNDLICDSCENYLSKLTSLRKQNIKLEFSVNKQQQQIDELKKTKQQLIEIIQKKFSPPTDKDSSSAQTTQKYQENTLKSTNNVYTLQNLQLKDDLEAELYEQKFLNNLLMLQITQLTSNDDSQSSKIQEIQLTAEKYEKILLQNFKLQAEVMTYKKIITDHQYRPIFHYNTRVQKLRNAVAYWYRVAMKQCKELRKQCKELGKQNKRNKQILINEFKKELESMMIKIKKHVPPKEFHSEYNDSASGITISSPIETEVQRNKFIEKNSFSITRHNIKNIEQSDHLKGHSFSSNELNSKSKSNQKSQRNSIESKLRQKRNGVVETKKKASDLRASKAYINVQKGLETRKRKSKISSKQICSKINCDANSNYGEYNPSCDNTVHPKSKRTLKN